MFVLLLSALFCICLSAAITNASPCKSVGNTKAPHASYTLPSSFSNITGNIVDGVVRFTLPYAQPPIGPLRFANPQPLTKVNGYDVTKTPPSCYQGQDSLLGGNPVSEDCLYSTFYIPRKASLRKNLPIFVWVHGGSGIVGSSTAAGLNGAPFVLSENVIVVIIQYRLGLFGWLQIGELLNEDTGGSPASGTVAGNQALRDVVMALQQVNDIAPVIGGSTSHIALMGQSSGAMMIRALLSTPSAEHLFTHAVLASDTADYGLANTSDNNALGEYAMSQLNCGLSDLNCARQASAEDVLNASLAAYGQVPFDHAGISSGTPYRPMLGKYIPGSIETGSKTNKPIIFTSVRNEAGTIAALSFDQTAANATLLSYRGEADATISLGDALDTVFNDGRGDVLANLTSAYPVSALIDGLRISFETVVTDGIWRCAIQNIAQKLSAVGSKVWLAQWNVGAAYPSNADADICIKTGNVCHEDDIYVIFGTAPSPSSAVKQITKEWQARLSAFVKSNQPNPAGFPPWLSVQSPSQLNLLSVGGTTNTKASTTCQSVWGSKVKFDWQLYET